MFKFFKEFHAGVMSHPWGALNYVFFALCGCIGGLFTGVWELAADRPAPAAAIHSPAVLETKASFYDSPEWACASDDFAPGQLIEVTHAGRTILVRVAGRGPSAKYIAAGRRLDLSAPAFAALADPRIGVIDVTAEGRGP